MRGRVRRFRGSVAGWAMTNPPSTSILILRTPAMPPMCSGMSSPAWFPLPAHADGWMSGPLREHRERSRAAWIFTSATLTVGGGFDHIATARAGRPADAGPSPSIGPSRRCVTCLKACPIRPRGFGTALIQTLRPVLQASQGRAFLLFASHRALREVAEALRDGPWPCRVRRACCCSASAKGNGVPLGSASFREGVDVVGEALSV